MRITRIFEDIQGHESQSGLSQDTFVELLARHKALLLRSDEDQDPWSVDDFAQTIEGLQLARYEYVGGAGKKIFIPSRLQVYKGSCSSIMFSLLDCII